MVPLVFVRPWNGFDPGARVNFPHPGLAEELIRRGVARRDEGKDKPRPKAAGKAK
jgi:hypothetical protein